MGNKCKLGIAVCVFSLVCGCLTLEVPEPGGGRALRVNPDLSKDYLLYSEYGARGDGRTDDFSAIVATHAAANRLGKTVRADSGAKYYIGGAARTARIETDTDWSGAEFIIDDTRVPRDGNIWRDSFVFEIASAKQPPQLPAVQTLRKDQEKLEMRLPSSALLVAINLTARQYIRRGANQNSGENQTDVFIVDADGNVDMSAPIIWDFDRVTSLTAYPIDEEVLTVKGGKFTTIANRGAIGYFYMKRGILITRSNTVIDGIVHLIEGEGNQGSPYDAFLRFENCANVTLQNATVTGHRVYSTNGVGHGTYDISAWRTINLRFLNCAQSNNINSNYWWGVMQTNFVKNVTLDNVQFSRFDAHMGVYNTTILNSELGWQGVSIIGKGLLRIENTKVSGQNFINLRDDYGSTWEGNLVIRNCVFAPQNPSIARVISTNNDGQWDFGYPCFMPETVTIDGLTIDEARAQASFTGVVLIGAVNNGRAEPHPYALTKTITLSGFESSRPYRMANDYIRGQITVVTP